LKTLARAAAPPWRLSTSSRIIVNHLARLPGLLGRARPELRPEYRSATFASYVIFLRYVDGSEPRETMEIIHFLHGARDIEAFFRRTYDDS